VLKDLLSRIFGRTRCAHADVRSVVEDCLQQGYRAQRAGERTLAERHYRHALERDPANVDAHYLLGALLGENGNTLEAAMHLDRALAGKPDFAEAHAARGNVYSMVNERRAAAASYEQALRLDPGHAVAHFNLALILQGDGRREDALHHFEKACALAPDLPDALKNLTLLQIEFARFEEAQSVLQRVLDGRPQHFDALKCMGFVLQKMHRPREALEQYLKARALNGHDAELLNNLGIVLQDLGRLDEAIASYDAAIALEPDFALAIWHRSLAYLLRHDFARGWPDYELRLVSADKPRRAIEYPRWDGTPLAGRRILVYAEQGLGDEIMFASCLPDVIAASAHCIIECSPRLESVFRRSFPAATVYAATDDRMVPQGVRDRGVDVQIPMGSLPLHLRRSRADFPRHHGYLKADSGLTEAWRARLDRLGSGPKVGISWHGGTHKTRRPVRSIPLAQWTPILKTAGAHFADLQYTDCTAEIDASCTAAGVSVHSWEETRSDYEQTVALAAALDLVLSVCTAIIHLGGALGTPVWVMAPYSPEWRYGIAGESMPWYPSVRIFRQPEYGDWEPVIGKVAQSLRAMIGSLNTPPAER